MSVYLKDSSVLLDGSGRVATGADCCCDCSLPEGDCPHSVCVDFTLDTGDTSNQDIVDFFSSAFVSGWGFYYDSQWNMYGFNFSEDETSSLSASSPFDTLHSLSVKMTRTTGDVVLVEWSVDGVSAPSFHTHWHCDNAMKLRCGAFNGSGDAHRSVESAKVLANPDSTETDFSFPSDSFDSFTGGASIVGGVLRVDSIGADAYADKDFDPGYNVTCTCPRDCDEIMGFTMSYEITLSGGTICMSGTCSDTQTWTRISKDDSFSEPHQFKLYINDACEIVYSDNRDFSPIGFDKSCASGSIVHASFVFAGNFPNTGGCCLFINSDPPVIVLDFFASVTGCGTCLAELGDTTVTLAKCDVSALVGTYTATNTCAGTPDGTWHVTATLEWF